MNARELHVFYALRRAYRGGVRAQAGRDASAQPDHADVRDVLDELDATRTVDSLEALDALKPDTVIRDADGYVCERWPAGWMAVALTDLHKPVLPVRIYALPEERS